MNIIDAIIKEPLGGAHRNKEQAVFSTKKVLMKYLEEFENNTRKEILEQRRKKFLTIGRPQSTTSFLKDEGDLVQKTNFSTTAKGNFIKHKNKLILIFLLFLAIILFFI